MYCVITHPKGLEGQNLFPLSLEVRTVKKLPPGQLVCVVDLRRVIIQDGTNGTPNHFNLRRYLRYVRRLASGQRVAVQPVVLWRGDGSLYCLEGQEVIAAVLSIK